MKRRYHSDPVFAAAQKKRVRSREIILRKKYKEILAEFRLLGCRICKELEPCCLVAHHVDPSKKEYRIGEARGLGIGIERFKSELAKCVCLCENCHRKVHAGIASLP